MEVPIIFRDVNCYIYTITPDCVIRKNGNNLQLDDIIYHSTNGYDYVLLETFSGNVRLYRLEFIMFNSFNPNTQMNHEHFKVLHVDGDVHNCNIDNLRFQEDIEEWRIVEFPEWIQRNQYAISTWGRFKNVRFDRLLSPAPDRKGYPRCSFFISNKSKQRFVHQLVADHYIPAPTDDQYDQINHIDGDPTNNHIANLEWSNNRLNGIHAFLVGLNPRRSIIPISDVDMIVELLVKHGGSIQNAYNDIDRSNRRNITYGIIAAIKYDKRYAEVPESKFYKNPITFTSLKESKLSTDDIDMIVDMLLDQEYDGSVTAVYNAIDHNRYPHISKGIINLIKCRNPIYYREDARYDLRTIQFKKKPGRWGPGE